ncbi:alpha/beta fold hydrolase [Flagellimonas sp. S3867]|uniref:alpha/beta fold hydrolase n=1 Tax=Flagellimonas sp. S3867 TaxID=2768063 RepID=UPI0016879FE4|nr:alpha/beta fold hydrolase [Flagellimonas sp. S3867]
MNSYNAKLYPFKSKWMDIDGNKIHYIDEGQGTTILFSHPPLGSSFMYREFIKYLRSKYRCIAIDYPGFGLSKANWDYKVGVEQQSIILDSFLQRLNLTDIYVVGHDTGGPSAFKVAIDRPDIFKGLILTDTVIYPISEYSKLAIMLDIVGSGFFGWLNARTNFLVRATFRYGIRTRKLSNAERGQYLSMFNTNAKRTRITQMLFDLKQNEAFMKKVKLGFETVLNLKPTLMVYGSKDPVRELGIVDRICKLLPNSELHLISNEGHFPHEGQPIKMSQLIEDWISKQG